MERKPDFRFTRLSPIQTHNFPRLKIKVTAAQTPAPNKHKHTHIYERFLLHGYSFELDDPFVPVLPPHM